MICMVYSGNLNRIFNAVVKQLQADIPIAEAVRRALSDPGKRWPDDDQLRQAVRHKPLYQQGRHGQRMAVLRRLDESFGSKERPDYDHSKLSIEHIMPQTLSDEWTDMLGNDARYEDAPAATMHRPLVHTLGNLTLTGYNPELGNLAFERKRGIYANSAFALTRAVSAVPRWGPVEILERAQDLEKRAIRIWPGPVSVPEAPKAASEWNLLRQALAVLPAGSWTTYGDVAALIGSHPVPVGQHVATKGVPNAHRVLTRDGTVSPNFRWVDPDDARDPHEVLRSEGVGFDPAGKANPNQRMTPEDLADLLGLGEDERARITGDGGEESDTSPKRRESFYRQLQERQPAETVAVVELLIERWRRLGGFLDFGFGQETSCFLMLKGGPVQRGNDLWPFCLYPRSGKVAATFRPLSTRPPFDDEPFRDEFRRFCNETPGVDLPAAKLALYPSFPLSVLTDEVARERLFHALEWFVQTAEEAASAVA